MKEAIDSASTQKKPPRREKNCTLTLIQVVCAICVVTMHTNGCFWRFSATEHYWFTANIIESLCYFAVPVFFMITGATLLDYQDRYSTKVYFRRRIRKTVVPCMAWSLVGLVFLIDRGNIKLETLTVAYVVNGLLTTSIIDFYWFFQPLFCVYLCIPLFAAIDKEKKRETARYLMTIAVAINIVPPFLSSVFKMGISWPYQVSVVSGYLFYVCAGWSLYNYQPSRRAKWIIYILGLAGLLAHIIGTYVLSIEVGSIQRTFKGYSNVPCAFYSCAVFLLLRDIGNWLENNRRINVIVAFLGEYTFPLYLLHWFALRVIIDGLKVDILNIFYRVGAPYVIFAAVIGVTWCLRKVPGIKCILP